MGLGWLDDGEPIISVCGIRPTCDFCWQHPEDSTPDDWNGETGNHYSCERVHPTLARSDFGPHGCGCDLCGGVA